MTEPTSNDPRWDWDLNPPNFDRNTPYRHVKYVPVPLPGEPAPSYTPPCVPTAD
jgi:hypothetical protein